jgi:hypothetical protein
MTNEFLVSVANAVLRDPTTGNALAYGTTNITSAFTLTTAATEVRGGVNNPLLYTYIHDRALEVKIESATFDKTVLGLNVGQLVQTGTVNVTQTDCIVLSASGSGLITLTPVGNVTVFLDNGTVQTLTPAVKTITASNAANQKVTAVYITSVSADQITVATVTPPSVVDLTLLAEVRSNTGAITQYLQINVPRFQVDGNYTLSLTSNGVSNQALNGKALTSTNSDCTSGDYYAKVTWIPVSSTSGYSSIASIPSTIVFSAANVPASQQITVLGIRGGLYANANITTSCSFVKSGSSGAQLSVNASSGVVSASAGSTNGQTCLIACNYTAGSLIDYVTVNVTA